MEQTLRISGIEPRSLVNGPGLRFVLWTQGCHLGCPGCFNPHTHDPALGTSRSVREIRDLVLDIEGLEGVTFTGGEPFEQAVPLAHLAREIRAAGLTVVCYSGHTLEELRCGGPPGALELLALTDILIDGRFDRSQASPLRWRGSRNQNVHILTGTYRHLEGTLDDRHAETEIHVGDGNLRATGIFDRTILQRLARALRNGSP